MSAPLAIALAAAGADSSRGRRDGGGAEVREAPPVPVNSGLGVEIAESVEKGETPR